MDAKVSLTPPCILYVESHLCIRMALTSRGRRAGAAVTVGAAGEPGFVHTIQLLLIHRERKEITSTEEWPGASLGYTTLWERTSPGGNWLPTKAIMEMLLRSAIKPKALITENHAPMSWFDVAVNAILYPNSMLIVH